MDPQEPEVLDPQLLENLRALQDPDEPDLAHELITLFLRDSGVRLARMREAVARGDRADVAEIAHQIKGSAGSLGASRLHDSASTLEQTTRHGSPDGPTVHAMYDDVSRAFEDVREALARLGFSA